MKKTYNKLVRDKIPEIIEANNQSCTIEVLSDKDCITFLEQKLNEECAEYQADKNIEELADILEVIYAIASARGVSKEALERVRQEKADKRGGFSKRIFLKDVYEK